jgi:dTDP-glucose 4,6-dehydratase
VRALASSVTFVADRPGHDFRYAIDASKIRNALGWAPAREFDTALQESVRWIIENAAWVARAQERIASARSPRLSP